MIFMVELFDNKSSQVKSENVQFRVSLYSNYRAYLEETL